MNTAFLFHRPQGALQVEIDPRSRRRLLLHRSGRGGPIAMAATLAAGTFAGAMLAPASGSAFSPAGSPANTVETAHTTPKTSRLPRAPAVTATQSAPGPLKAPGACMPSSPSSSHGGPVAYV